MDAQDDAVERNRAANPRRTPDREPVGNDLMPALYLSAAAAIVIATVVLVLLVAI